MLHPQARSQLREIHASLLESHLRQLQAAEMDVDVAKAMGWERPEGKVGSPVLPQSITAVK